MRFKKECVWFEIFLFVMLSFASAYIIRESSKGLEGELLYKDSSVQTFALKIVEKILRGLFGGNLVSAAVTVNTCLENKNGSFCQEYLSNVCEENCKSSCIPAERKNVAECKLGTCYDAGEGTCQAGSPKALCEKGSGSWFSDANENIPECKKGCCVLGDNVAFSTEQQCVKMSSSLGMKKDYRGEIRTEIACLALAKTQEEGACVLAPENPGEKNNCKFTTKQECLTLTGDFYKNKLCSNPLLNTVCEKQKTSSCVQGRDEIYWFDSCGNRENVYDINKVKSWNTGEVLDKNNSCSIGNINNPLDAQKTCGNCNYLFGSRCGLKTASEKLADDNQEYVCRDLRCTDEKGEVHENGEAWCAYQGSIGVDSAKNRGMDTAGSRHFRKVCLDGEIRTEPCADYRNGVCIESQIDISSGKKFTTSACVLNDWQECAGYNVQDDNGGDPAGAQAEVAKKCLSNNACYIKKVDIGSKFHFDMCAPKFNPGFDLKDNGEGAQQVCRLATTTCTAVKVKKISGWKWAANEECTKPIFAEKMNDLCMSFGDCGTKVNYQGELTQNVRVTGSPGLSEGYLQSVKIYSQLRKGVFASVGDAKQGAIGIPEDLGKEDYKGEGGDKTAGSLSMISGAMGAVYGAAIWGIASTVGISGVTVAGAVATIPAGTALGAFSSAFTGAMIGAAVVLMLIKFLGIGAGLSPGIIYGLAALGATAGALIASGSTAVLGNIAGISITWPVVGWIIAIVVVLIIAILKIIGVGKIKKIQVSFTCMPWQPPLGGANCEKCGKDGLPCSQYSCASLGQTCELVNAGTGSEMCVNVAPNDVAPPVIKENPYVLRTGERYELMSNGFKLKSNESGGCFKAFSPVVMGVTLNEPGQCKYMLTHTNKFEDMEENYVSGGNLFIYNHTMRFRAPSLSALGVPGVGPDRQGEFNVYIRCQDKSGNSNVNEYTASLCVTPEDDVTAPIISGREPVSENVAFNSVNASVSVFVNEPAECRWSERDEVYNIMQNELACNTGIEQEELLGWRCSDTFAVKGNETQYYVRCLDQPWLSEASEEGEVNSSVGDESKRNVMTSSYFLNIKKSRTPLKIEYVIPDNQTIASGVEPVTVNLEARTSGGLDGTAVCSYVFGNNSIQFFDTYSNLHKQPGLQGFTSGAKAIPVVCTDFAGNEAKKTARFNIEIDRAAPEVTRISLQGNSLTIKTNEPAICTYSNFGCEYSETDEGVGLFSGQDVEHSTSADLNQVYYIKCKDRFENSRGGCSAIVKPVDFA